MIRKSLVSTHTFIWKRKMLSNCTVHNFTFILFWQCDTFSFWNSERWIQAVMFFFLYQEVCQYFSQTQTILCCWRLVFDSRLNLHFMSFYRYVYIYRMLDSSRWYTGYPAVTEYFVCVWDNNIICLALELIWQQKSSMMRRRKT